MMLSSSASHVRWSDRVSSTIAQQRPEDVDSTSCEGDDSLDMGASASSFLQVVVAVRSFAHHGGLRRQVEHVPQPATVSAWFVQISGSSPRIVGYWHQPGGRSQMPGGGKGPKVTSRDQQRRAENRSEPGHRFDDRTFWLANMSAICVSRVFTR